LTGDHLVELVFVGGADKHRIDGRSGHLVGLVKESEGMNFWTLVSDWYGIKVVRNRIHRDARLVICGIQKILEDANLKLGSVLSDVLGRSGLAMLEAIIQGKADPEKLADLARGTARKKRAELIEALRGRVTQIPFRVFCSSCRQ